MECCKLARSSHPIFKESFIHVLAPKLAEDNARSSHPLVSHYSLVSEYCSARSSSPMTASSVTGLPAIDSQPIRYFLGQWSTAVLGVLIPLSPIIPWSEKYCSVGVLIPLSPIIPWSVEYCSARSSHPLVSHYSLVSGVLQC